MSQSSNSWEAEIPFTTPSPRTALDGLLMARGAVCSRQLTPLSVLHLLSLISLLFIFIDPSFFSGITQEVILLLGSKI